MSPLKKFKPAVNKKTLYIIAAVVWTIAGSILIIKSLYFIFSIHEHIFWKIIIGIISGIGFYFLLFTKISKKNIKYIDLIIIENPCFFSFFNFKSYIMMAVMISGGIMLRKFEIINIEYLSVLYLSMGIPLLISAFRFYSTGIKYKSK